MRVSNAFLSGVHFLIGSHFTYLTTQAYFKDVFAKHGTVRVFPQKCAIEDAIEFRAFAPLEALPCV